MKPLPGEVNTSLRFLPSFTFLSPTLSLLEKILTEYRMILLYIISGACVSSQGDHHSRTLAHHSRTEKNSQDMFF